MKTLDHQDFCWLIESIMSKTCIPISNKPISETMDIDKLGVLYQAFPWIKQTHIKVPMTDSNGNIRFVDTRRPMIAAPQYCIRLKQLLRRNSLQRLCPQLT